MANASAVPVSGPQLDNRRVLAALIDVAVVIAGAMVIFGVAGVSSASEIPASLDAVVVGWALYYYFAMESSEAAQTLGKRVMNIRVVRMDGSPTTMREIAVRTVLRVIDAQFFYLVGLIVMLATGQRRGRLGDLAAGTKIVSAGAPARAHAAGPAAAEAAPESSRVPIAESGPAFAEPAQAEPSEAETVDMTSPSLKELAEDVETTAGSAPDEQPEAAEPAPEPVPDLPEEEEPADDELAPAAEADEPEVEVAPEPAADADVEEPAEAELEEPVAEAEPDEEPEDDPLADASDDELDEAEIAAAVEAELNGESAPKARGRSSARAKR
jgi:uncharacterized RDD family membrane protein YckC